MTKYPFRLLFHSFSADSHADPFYDISLPMLLELLKTIRSCDLGFLPIISIDDGFLSSFEIAKQLRYASYDVELFMITSRIGSSGFLGVEQLMELHSLGVEIGSHTHTHKNLSTVDFHTLVSELYQSLRCLQEIFPQKNSFSLSLPYGGFTPMVLDYSLTCYSSILSSSPFPIPFCPNLVPRFPVHSRTSVTSVLSYLRGSPLPLFKLRFLSTFLLRLVLADSCYRSFKSLVLRTNSLDIV